MPPPKCGSPEPRLIAFQRTSDGNTDIYRLDVASPEPEGGQAVRITSHPAADTAPAWAQFGLDGNPDPTQPRFSYPPIAFERDLHGKRDIFVANYDGTDASNLTETPDVDEANPDWLVWLHKDQPGHLVFDSDRGGRREVWVMDVRYNAAAEQYERLATRKVTDGPGGFSVNPSWFTFLGTSGYIDTLAFAGADEDGGDSQIHFAESRRVALPFSQMPVNETLTSNPSEDTTPAWSPTGDRIAYQSNRDGNSEIYVMDLLGEENTDLNLTQSPGNDRNPDWQGMGFKIDEVFPVRARGRRSRPRGRVGRGVGGEPPVRVRPQGGSKCRKTGTPKNDLLCGTPRPDVLRGKGGDDRILGRGGNDRLLGGPGNDRIRGGPGSDKIRGGAGADRLNGGPGRDNIGGGVGGDRIEARDRQRDRVSGGPGRDRLIVDRNDRLGPR
jgi:Tol biopolymer transport system component